MYSCFSVWKWRDVDQEILVFVFKKKKTIADESPKAMLVRPRARVKVIVTEHAIKVVLYL